LERGFLDGDCMTGTHIWIVAFIRKCTLLQFSYY